MVARYQNLSELPAEVLALAKRLGARGVSPESTVHLNQSGEMFLRPGGKALPFTAKQEIATSRFEFRWDAWIRLGPLLRLNVSDYMSPEKGGLRARLRGIIPLFDKADDDFFLRGEALRYFAELIWNPEAILSNRSLEWRVVSPKMLDVSAQIGPRLCRVRFHLNEQGEPERMTAEKRPTIEGKSIVERPWFGRCRACRDWNGYFLPSEAEVGWLIDGQEFIYWRGKMESWEIRP